MRAIRVNQSSKVPHRLENQDSQLKDGKIYQRAEGQMMILRCGTPHLFLNFMVLGAAPSTDSLWTPVIVFVHDQSLNAVSEACTLGPLNDASKTPQNNTFRRYCSLCSKRGLSFINLFGTSPVKTCGADGHNDIMRGGAALHSTGFLTGPCLMGGSKSPSRGRVPVVTPSRPSLSMLFMHPFPLPA